MSLWKDLLDTFAQGDKGPIGATWRTQQAANTFAKQTGTTRPADPTGSAWKPPHHPSKNPESGAGYHWKAPANRSSDSGAAPATHYTPPVIDRRYAPFAGIPMWYTWATGVGKRRYRKRKHYKPRRHSLYNTYY